MATAVVLLSDFGTREWYVASMKGVILSRAPRALLVDLTHEIPPHDIVAGALTLAAASPWFPRGTVFLAVVDPGVGTERALLAASANGRYFVGPDNGLLALSLARTLRPTIVQLMHRRYWLHPVSCTFHGRDILAPVAAYLARGGALNRLGSSITRIRPTPLLSAQSFAPQPPAFRRGRRQIGRIIHIDCFGNLITDFPASLLVARGAMKPARIRYKRKRARVVSSYAEGGPSELIALAGSVGFLELAIRERSAQQACAARRGDRVELFM